MRVVKKPTIPLVCMVVNDQRQSRQETFHCSPCSPAPASLQFETVSQAHRAPTSRKLMKRESPSKPLVSSSFPRLSRRHVICVHELDEEFAGFVTPKSRLKEPVIRTPVLMPNNNRSTVVSKLACIPLSCRQPSRHDRSCRRARVAGER